MGATLDDAIREMFQFHYNPFWFRIPRLLRGIDVDKLESSNRRAIDFTAAPHTMVNLRLTVGRAGHWVKRRCPWPASERPSAPGSKSGSAS